MEHVKDIPKLKDLDIAGDIDMAINCEWVAYFDEYSSHYR